MTPSIALRLLAGASAFAAAGFTAAPAVAETAPDAPAALNAPILVTATKKVEAQDIQSAPLAINAFDAAALDSVQVRDLSSLTHAIPGVSLDQIGGFRGVANWSIRGLGINSSIASMDPAVSTLVDGVYVGINPGAAFDLFDIDRIEVLRGPQGTLLGRNSTGGAVLIETANPQEEWGARVRLSADGPVDGGRGAMAGSAQGTVTGPLAPGLSFRLGAYHASDGGYFRNLYNGGNLGKAETTVLRGGLKYASGALTVVAKGEYLKATGDGAPGQNHGLFARDTFNLSLDNEGFIDARIWSASLRADYDLGDSKITNIAGWRNLRQFTSNDIDSSPAFLFHSNTGLTQEQWSDELRWAGSLSDTIDLTVGGFVFAQKVAYEEDRRFGSNDPATFRFGGGRQDHDVQALFAQGDWEFVPTLTATAGLRWSRESKKAAITFVGARTPCSVVSGTCPITGNRVAGEPNGFTDKRTWTAWSPRLGLSWQPATGVQAYATWSRGNRSGGYNLRITQPAAFLANAAALGSPAFDAEQVDSYEAGLKLQTADRRLTVNLAAYQTDVGAMQREVSQSDGGSGLAQSIYNTADAHIRGAEAELRFAATPHLLLSANIGHIDAAYIRVFYDLTGNGTVDAADRALALPRVPKWTWGLAALHELPLGGDARLVSRVDFNHRSRYAYTDSNYGWVDASDNLDASVTWHLPVRGISLTVYGRNLLDEVQFGSDTQIPFGGRLSDGTNVPFDPRPAAGTFSPLNKGRVVGAALAMEF